MPHNSVRINILKLITLRFALVTVMLCAFSGAAFAQLTATFKNYDGTVLYTQKNIRRNQVPQYKGSTPTRPADAQYTYTFKGWSPTIKAITTNTTYTAQFTATVRKYTITFLNGDGSTLQSSSVEYGSTPSCSSTPTKAATAQYTYTFKAWSPAIAKVTGAATYTPTFNQTVRSYAIKFVDGDGKTVQSSTLQYGATPSYTGSTPTKTATAQYTYTFKAWSPTIAKVTGTATYTATFTSTVRSYTITFKNGSTTLQSKAFNYGATPTYSGATPTKAPSGDDTFVFTGWSPAITKVTGAKTYSAVFAKGTYDACGNAYTYVKIGNQTWLTENMRCNKYDTNSERAGATISTSTSAEQTYTPYYKLVSDKSLWSNYTLNRCATAMSDAQLTSAGYLYNWAAAVGVATASEAQSDAAFGTPRQGICPNGWHVPNIEELTTLKNYVGSNSADKLRTVNGWCNDDYRYQDGLDTFGFAGLGAGYFEGTNTGAVAELSYFWSATSEVNRKNPYYAQTLQLWTIYRDAGIKKNYVNVGEKYKGYSVRCMKGPQYTIKFVNYDGTVLQSLKVTESYTPSYTGATPTRAKTAQYTYTFKGWDSTIGAATADKTYTATYTSTTNSYTIRFLNGTSVLQSRNMAYGITPTYTGSTPTKAATAEYSYTFSGWSPAIASVSKAQDYTAQFTESKRKYTIKFANYDGTVLQSEELEYGVTPTYKSSTPTRPDDVLCANYVFTGWSPSISSVTGSVTYKALFTGESKTYDAPENSHTIIKIPDICGNKYNVVKIGSQLWLAENMRCNKYDTESERAGAVIPHGGSSGINPYFQAYPLAVSNATTYAGNLSTSQIPYLGLFYSWSAAVGLTTGEQAQAQTTGFDGDRQGICPNGWHIPVMEEWEELVNYIEVTDGKGEGTAGLHLKTTSGWYNDKNGTDTYGFSALPADRGTTTDTYGVGGWAKYWTPTAKSASSAYACQVKYGTDAFLYSADEAGLKSRDALCVRCVKNPEKFEIKFVNYDGTELQSTEVEYGSLPEYKGDTPVRDADAQYTYTFSGWSPEVAVVTEAATYTAQFDNTVNKYVVRFLNDDGTELQSSELEYGTTPEYTGETPTKQATAQYTYTFNGWDSDIEAVTGAKDYTATYTPTTNKYVVRFLNEDGTELQSSELEYGVTPAYTGETPTKEATAQYTYTFAGWDSEIAEVTGAKDYTATYTPTTNKYTVRFLNDDGTELQSEELEYGATPAYTGETPTKDATAQYTYTFNGWDSEIAEVTGAKDYTATYAPTTNKYLITFENYNGEELQSGEVEYGQTPAYTGATPEKPADAENTYVFTGWSPEITSVTSAQAYTAQYRNTTNTYIIRFLNEDGTELQSEELAYGATPAYTGETPTKDATAQYTYTFNGWDSEITAVTGAKDYTATYTPTTNKYVVRFLNEDGTELQSEELEYGVTPAYTGETPTKEATAQYTYTFNGWDSEIVAVTGAKDYTATYTPTTNKYLITFENYDGEELQSGEVEYGQTPSYTGEVPEKPADAENTYVFTGWSPELTSVTEAKTYTAQFSSTTNKYLVRFLNDDGTELQSEELAYGATPAYTGETPTKEATAQYTYTFAGWDSEIADVTGAKDYTATYTPSTNKYVVRFLNEDGTELQSEELEYGTTPAYTGETPTKDATAQYTYTFAGWNNDIVAVTGAKDYTATYAPTTNKYLITFVNYDGEELQSGEVEYGQTPNYTGETPEKPSDAENTYVFNGWSPEITTVTATQTYTAQFRNTTNTYIIRFLNEDGTELQSEELEYGATPAYTGETPTKDATAQYTYTFNGWDSDIEAVTGAKDYTATYTPTTNKYTVRFLNDDGTELQSEELEYGATPAYTGETPTKDATAQYTYTFNGWDSDIEAVTGAKDYTATYTPTTNKYVVRFLNEDGTELQSDELAYGATPAYTGETPTKDATAQYTYTFNGWDSEITAVTGAKDYTATYAPTTNKYLITFENYNGDELQSGEVEYGQTPAYTGATPEKPADAENTYVFNGWSPEITTVIAAQTYTAQFRNTTNTYIIRFLNEDGTELQSSELEYGATPAYTGETPTKDATAQYTYTFAGWDSEIAEVTGAKDYTATYSPTTNKYVVRFLNEDGTELQSEELEYGTTPAYNGETPTKEATAQYTYTFAGWDSEIAEVSGAKDYTATYTSTVNKYTIVFKNYNGEELQSVEVEYGQTPTYTGATPEKPADKDFTYTFEGWIPEITTVTAGQTCTAQFSRLVKSSDAPENSHSIEIVTDICGNKYNVVKIGSQLWLAENMRCNKYDTESEKAGQSFSTSSSAIYAPYYTGCFTEGANVTISPNNTFTDEQWDYLGLLYNWAAALGLSEGESRAQTREFKAPRQGICPNGYHVPSDAEWLQLIDYIENTDGKGEGTAAKHLKATSGWAPNSNNGNGLDTYGFSLLPVDRGVGKTIYGIGTYAKFTTASAKSNTFADYMNVDGDALVIVGNVGYTSAKSHIYTVRCVREAEKFEIKFVNYDGTELQSTEVEYGSLPEYTGETPAKDATSQYTYTFSGWSPDVIMVTEATTYTAQFSSSVNKYVVRFLNDDGMELQSEELEYGVTPAYTGETPTKDATAQYTYTFAGWDSEIADVTGAKDYTATYTPTTNKYTVRFLNDDGTELQSEELEYGTTPEYTGETPTKDATAQYTYTFAGWDSEIAEVTGAKDYTATYTPATNKYVVRFLNEDGTELQSEELEYGVTPAYTGETPTKDATAQYTYTFAGWDSEIAEVTGAKDYTATYSPTTNKYVVRFLNEDGTELQSDELDYGATPAYTRETPTKDATAQYTYTFNGWDSEIAEVTGAKDYTATYTPTTNKYTVRFLNEDGTELQSEELDYGATPAYTGETPTKEATAQYTYTFAGWDSDIEAVTGAKDYTATYTPTTNKYTVRFLNDDGTELQSEELEYGVTPAYTGETPTKDATAQYTYTFNGWDSEIAEVTGAKDYTATYTPTTNKYTVRFLNDDGTALQSEELAFGAIPAYNGTTPAKDATAQYTYTFNGWDSEITAVTGAKDYTATYTPTTNKYTVRFLNKDGTELQSEKLEYGTTPAYTGETPTKDATAQYTYTFNGWDSEITAVTGAKDYTATYSPTTNKYVVRFLNEDGTEFQSEELAYGTIPVYAGATPTKQATAQYTYMFSGWDSEIVEVTGAKDYTATYTSTVNKYPIAFVNYDGFELQITPVEYGQTPVYTSITPWKPADAEFTYTFSGWSPEVTSVVGAQTYTAQFSSTTNKYTVRFLNEDGAELQSEELAYGSTPAYTGETPTKQETAKYTYTFKGWDSDIEVVRGAKDYTATYTAIPVHQTADNTPECANAPAVAKYDWLLMLNANAIKDMGYNLNENIVEWYRVVGEMDNLDSGERDDEKVGSGYYYTINSKLNDSGDYYALIDLPWQTSEVGCNGLMRTVVFHYAPKGSTKRAMAVSPTIAYPQQEIEVRDLPQEVAEVYVYDVAGRLYRSFRTNGEATAMFNAEQNAGTYIVVVWTSKGKETFKYIVRKR